MRNLFKNRNFMLLFNGSLVSSIGDVLFNFAIGLYILDVTHSAFQLSVYGLIGGVTWMVISPFGGVWSDRLNRVKIIYLTDFIRGITMLLCGFIMLQSDDSAIIMATLYFTAFIIAVNGSLFGPASLALVPVLVEQDDLINANSLMSLMYNIKDVFGMLLAGVMFALIGPVAIVFINGISYLVSAITEMFISVKQETVIDEVGKKNVLSDLADGFRYIMRANSGIITILILLNLKNLALGPIQSVLLPYLLNEQIGANQMDLSVIYMCSALGGIFGSLIVSKGLQDANVYKTIKQSFVLLLVTVVAQYVAFLMFEGQVAGYLVLFMVFSLTFVIAGIVGIVFYVPLYTMLQKLIEPAYYGRVMALFTMLSSISFPVSSLMGGSVIDHFGVSMLFAICSLLLTVSIGYLVMCKGKLNGDFAAKKDSVIASL